MGLGHMPTVSIPKTQIAFGLMQSWVVLFEKQMYKEALYE